MEEMNLKSTNQQKIHQTQIQMIGAPDNIVENIQNAIRLKQGNYRNLVCPICKEKPFVERSIKTPGNLIIRCKCGTLDLNERGI